MLLKRTIFAVRQVVIVLILVTTSSGGSDHVSTAGTSAAGFADVNSTIATSPLPKKAIKKSQTPVVASLDGKSAALDAMELIDPKASEQVLELIVKIAEHPATWKQIHRVLETLEANNAAYSQRIDVTRNELGWMTKRLDRPGDKRNDVPDEKIAVPSNTTSTTISPSSLETAFQRWRNVLFSSAVPKELEAVSHPQLEASEMRAEGELKKGAKGLEWSSSIPPVQTEHFRAEKKFEDRLNDIEEELKKLSKLSRMMPLKLKQIAAIAGHQQERKIKSSKNPSRNAVHQNENVTESLPVAQKSHPKFQYHKVHNATNQPELTGNLLGPNFWRKIASLKHNGSNPTSRRNSFVAVSISPHPDSDKSKSDESLISIGHQGMLATEPMKPESTKPDKKSHNVRKPKQRQPSRRPVSRNNAEV